MKNISYGIKVANIYVPLKNFVIQIMLYFAKLLDATFVQENKIYGVRI